MMIKYESELLFDLMKRDGDDSPSDVLPYESELKEKYLNQVVGAYPKLQDYRPEWLYYNLYHHIPSDFPIESVANVTSASFYDVVPYAYKSAILKGSTKYRDIDTGDVLDTFDETKNLELVSVKMPVLTTTGKNLFNYKNYVGQIEGVVEVENGLRVSGWAATLPFINNLLPNTTYTTKHVMTVIEESVGATDNGSGKIYLYNGTNYLMIFATNGDKHTFTTPPNIKSYDRILFYAHGGGGSNNGVIELTNIQLEEGSTATSYEPFKSNILTTNEDVELRKVGDVQDELDCLTGELVQNIGEIMLNGSEKWALGNSAGWSEDGNTVGFYFKIADKKTSIACSDKLPLLSGIKTNDIECFYINVQQNWVGIRLSKSKLSNLTVKGLQTYLQSNPITIQYQSETPTIKSADLSCINEQGESTTFRPNEGTMHVNTSSQSLPPLLDMSVPVEATTQNLMSFSNISEEE